MKHNNEIVALALVFLLGAIAGNAQAASVIGDYELHGAPVDPLVYGGQGSHAIWFAQGTNDYVFASGAGSLTEYDDGTATIRGTAYSVSQPGSGFAVELLLEIRTSIAPPGSPKKELFDSAYTENGGPIDAATWYYYEAFTGSLTGVGGNDGIAYTITQRGPAFQVGMGASGKNLDLGAAAWFWAEDEHGNQIRGDFNLNLTPVPVPAALPLMTTALIVLGLTRRRA